MSYINPRVFNTAAGLTAGRRVLLGTPPAQRLSLIKVAKLGTTNGITSSSHTSKFDHVTPASKPAEHNNGRHYKTLEIQTWTIFLWGTICFATGFYMGPSGWFVKTKVSEPFATE